MSTALALFVESVEEVFLDLKGKFDKSYALRTIIGKNYRRSSGQPIVVKNPIQKDHYDEESGPGIVSVSYGPLYHGWGNAWKIAKEQAWDHIVLRSSTSTSSNGDIINENVIARLYVDAVGSLENDCRTMYGADNPLISNLDSDQFIWMMIIDGCFLLQVALFVLGGSKLLDYPEDHPVFGNPTVHQESIIRQAVLSMFVVGNQIPLVVLKALMRQSFFNKVVNEGRWEEPLDLKRWVLFELILVPAILDVRGGATVIDGDHHSFFHRYFGNFHSFLERYADDPFSVLMVLSSVLSNRFQRKQHPSKNANDILHGLWMLTTGLDHSTEENDGKDGEHHGSLHSNSETILQTIRSAAELKDVGVVFQYNKGTTMDGVIFRELKFNAFVLLPHMVIDSDTDMYKLLLSNLISYECMHFNRSKWKVCEYLQLMRELLRTPKDAETLAAMGIIVVDRTLEKDVPHLFEDLPIPILRSYSGTIRRIRAKLNNYTQRSVYKKASDLATLVVVLTVIQAIFAILSYFHRK